MSTPNTETNQQLSDEQLHMLFEWLDKIPLSRKKKNITRDFSDGVLVAEIVHHFVPKLVELHNYNSANSTNQKMTNWDLLNRKVLSKLNFAQPAKTVKEICECVPGVVEVFLYHLTHKLDAFLLKYSKKTATTDRPYYNARTSTGGTQANSAKPRSQANQNQNQNQDAQASEYIVRNPLPLSELNLSSLSEGTRLILEEKEQALLASQETVQILQVKIRRLEHLLQLKDLRIEEVTKRLKSLENMMNIQ